MQLRRSDWGTAAPLTRTYPVPTTVFERLDRFAEASVGEPRCSLHLVADLRAFHFAAKYAEHEPDELLAIVSLLADRADQTLRAATGIARLPLLKLTCSVSNPRLLASQEIAHKTHLSSCCPPNCTTGRFAGAAALSVPRVTRPATFG